MSSEGRTKQMKDLRFSFGIWLFFSLRLRVEHLMARLHFGFLSLPDLRLTTNVFSQKEGDGVGVHSGRVTTHR